MLNGDGEEELKMGSAAERIVLEHRFSSEDVLTVVLRVTDPEVVAELLEHPEGPPREQYALSALRLGVLALRQASGSIDTERIRTEGERLVADVRELLADHTGKLTEKLGGAIAQYFDPQTGNLVQRLDRLVHKDGDLESVLARYLDGDSSALARTLAKHVGEISPLLQQLSPTQSDGFLAVLQQAIEEALREQRRHILREFSLDDKESALSRLIGELTGANGKLREDLANDIETVRKEFSLDQPDGALSRLVKRVDETTAQVRGSLTLDDAGSPLARLRKELLEIFKELSEAQRTFQTEVRATLESLQARRAESARSTRHGLEFEDAVAEVLAQLTRNNGDVLEAVGQTVGRIPRCKVGDFVLALGLESAAPGARIVIEAKENRSYETRKMLEELAQARENRGAQVGVAILSRATVPADIEPLTRFGADIVVVWDRDDATSDVLVTAALSLARALVVRERVQREKVQAEFSAIEDAVRRIAKAAESLSEIVTMAGTVRSHGEKIRTRAEKLQEDIDEQLGTLQRNVEGLKQHAGDQETAA
jgi:gas vesicle protein